MKYLKTPLLLLLCSAAYRPAPKQEATQQIATEKLDWSTTSPIPSKLQALPKVPAPELPPQATPSPQNLTPTISPIRKQPTRWPTWKKATLLILTFVIISYLIYRWVHPLYSDPRDKNPKEIDEYANDSEDEDAKNSDLKTLKDQFFLDWDDERPTTKKVQFDVDDEDGSDDECKEEILEVHTKRGSDELLQRLIDLNPSSDEEVDLP